MINGKNGNSPIRVYIGNGKLYAGSRPPRVVLKDNSNPAINDAGGVVGCRAHWAWSWWDSRISHGEQVLLDEYIKNHAGFDVDEVNAVNLLIIESDTPGYGGCGYGVIEEIIPYAIDDDGSNGDLDYESADEFLEDAWALREDLRTSELKRIWENES